MDVTQTLLEIEQTLAEYEIPRQRADYLPRFTSSVETKAFLKGRNIYVKMEEEIIRI